VDAVVVGRVGLQVFQKRFQNEIASFDSTFPLRECRVFEIRILRVFELSPIVGSSQFPIGQLGIGCETGLQAGSAIGDLACEDSLPKVGVNALS